MPTCVAACAVLPTAEGQVVSRSFRTPGGGPGPGTGREPGRTGDSALGTGDTAKGFHPEAGLRLHGEVSVM